jgi:hypothetical protein
MRKNLTDRILRRWPDWFRIGSDTPKSVRFAGFECFDGWFDIIWRSLEAIEPSVVREKERWRKQKRAFQIVQVKEKFGALHIYCSPTTVKTQGAFEQAEKESLRTCEMCGRPGHLREDGGLLRVRCEECEAPSE